MKNPQMQMASLGWLRPSLPLTVQAGRAQRVPEAPALAALLEKSN